MAGAGSHAGNTLDVRMPEALASVLACPAAWSSVVTKVVVVNAAGQSRVVRQSMPLEACWKLFLSSETKRTTAAVDVLGRERAAAWTEPPGPPGRSAAVSPLSIVCQLVPGIRAGIPSLLCGRAAIAFVPVLAALVRTLPNRELPDISPSP